MIRLKIDIEGEAEKIMRKFMRKGLNEVQVLSKALGALNLINEGKIKLVKLVD